MSSTTEAIKNGLRVGVDVAVKAVIAAAVTAVPFLGVVGVNQIFTWIVNWVAGKLLPILEVWFVERAIDIELNAKKQAFAEAKVELRLALQRHIRDPKEVARASQEFDSRIDGIIRIHP